MDAAIDLDNQLEFVAIKICNIASDGMLTTKFITVQTVITEAFPKHGLGIGGIFTEISAEG